MMDNETFPSVGGSHRFWFWVREGKGGAAPAGPPPPLGSETR